MIAIVIPKTEIDLGTTRAHVPGFVFDLDDTGNVRVYERGETARGLDRSPRIDRYCVLRRALR